MNTNLGVIPCANVQSKLHVGFFRRQSLARAFRKRLTDSPNLFALPKVLFVGITSIGTLSIDTWSEFRFVRVSFGFLEVVGVECGGVADEFTYNEKSFG